MTPDTDGPVIVAGALFLDPADRERYLRDCAAVVEQARAAPGCVDFALSPDLVEADRINVFEHWRTDADLRAFRGAGPDAGQAALLREVRVDEHRVVHPS